MAFDEISRELDIALKLGDRLAEMLDAARQMRARRRVNEADRVVHFLQASFTFKQSENVSSPLVFTVPAGHSFEARRLALYPEVRLVSAQSSDNSSDATFRPTAWTCAVNNILTGTPFSQWFATNTDRLVDAQVALSLLPAGSKEPRPLQNAAFSIAHLFCSALNSDLVGTSAISARPSAKQFCVPLRMGPGAALQVQVTPTFSGVRTTDTRLNEYRIVGVLEGFKRLTQ